MSQREKYTSFQISNIKKVGYEKDHKENCKLSLNKINKLLTNLTAMLSSFTYTSKNCISSSPQEIISKLSKHINKLITHFNIIALNTYEPILRSLEKQNRNQTQAIIQLSLQREALEGKILYLLDKEREYEKIKREKNIYIEDGKIICNDIKENEILILRAENSNLKAQIQKDEKEKTKLRSEILNFNRWFPTSQRGVRSSTSIGNLTSSECSPKNFITNRKQTSINKNLSSEITTNMTDCHNKNKMKYDLTLNNGSGNYEPSKKKKVFMSPDNKIISALYISRSNNSRDQRSSQGTISQLTNTKVQKSFGKQKSSMNNTRKKCNVKAIKNLFIQPNSTINTYLLYKNFYKNHQNNLKILNGMSSRSINCLNNNKSGSKKSGTARSSSKK